MAIKSRLDVVVATGADGFVLNVGGAAVRASACGTYFERKNDIRNRFTSKFVNVSQNFQNIHIKSKNNSTN